MKKKMDEGHEETEKILKRLEKEISDIYKEAEKEVSEKLDDYLRRFQIKDELKQRAVEAGQITESEYKQWRTGQIMMGKRWSEMRETLAEDLANAAQKARSIAFDSMADVYALNHNYGTFQVEQGALVDTSYTLYDRNTVEYLFKDNKFIPAPGKKVSRNIAMGKEVAWDRKNVQSCMLQGILQGESIPKMATRLSKSVGDQSRKACIRNVRTMTTGVQNAGRMASYERAEEMGIKVKKQWMATLDMRTRHWHAELDGEIEDIDEPFENEYGKIMYPGDPNAEPANIFNCRCTLIAAIEGFERDLSDLNLRHDDHLGDMTYDEWKAEHETYSDKITKQDEISESMKAAYNSEYQSMRDLTGEEEDSAISDSMRDHAVKFDPKSEEFTARLESLGESEEVTHTMVNEINSIMKHRGGTTMEDIVYINSETGKVMRQTKFNEPKKVNATKEMKSESRNNPGKIIAIHNHPGSTPPGSSDFFAAYENKYKYGLVVGHDGSLYKYTPEQKIDRKYTDDVEMKITHLYGAIKEKDDKEVAIVREELYNEYGINLEVK